jgi:hypothetical protein
MNTQAEAHMDETKRRLRTTLLHWLVLVLLFDLALAAEHLWYREDLLGHLSRHWPFAILFAALLNAFFAAAMLVEVYLLVFFNKTLGWLRHAYRIAFFLILLCYFVFSIKGFYDEHTVPHYQNGPSFLYKQ